MTDEWNFPAVFEAVAHVRPDEPALIHGDVVLSWSDFMGRVRAVAGGLRDEGLSPGDPIALYMPNRPEYMVALTGALAGGFVPFNTNYRYVPDEIEFIWRDAPAHAVIYDASFGDEVDELRQRMRSVRIWVQVGAGGSTRVPDGVTTIEGLRSSSSAPALGDAHDATLLLYTGGTTGMPKGVVWGQGDLLTLLATAGSRGIPDRATGDVLVKHLKDVDAPPPMLVACPLMHGTGLFHALGAMSAGAAIVTLPTSRLDIPLLLDTIDRHSVGSLVIVGDPFARPIVEHLDAQPSRWDLSSLRLVFSSGAMWSHEVKARLLRHAPKLNLVDGLGSSEATSLGSSVSSGTRVDPTATFVPGKDTAVLLDDGTRARPGDGKTGLLAVSGPIPLGYHNDPEKTAQVFREVDGRRWSVPGDFAQLEPDGRVRLLGRGSGCINTAGEKVFPEEVEEALKKCVGVADAAVFGVADQRFGQVVVALAETSEGGEIDAQQVRDDARRHLAGYKVPKLIHQLPSLDRAPNGKLDQRRLATIAKAAWAEHDG